MTMIQMRLLGKDVPLLVVQSEVSGLFGVVDKDFNLILPFEYNYIDPEVSVGSIIFAKDKNNKKVLLEITED
jgi:hypothetical protein